MKGCVNSVEKLAGNSIEDGGSQITEQISGGKSQSQESYDHGENYEKYDYNIDPASMVDRYYSYADNKFENNIPETIPEKSSGGLGSHEFPWEIFHKSHEQITEQFFGGNSKSPSSYEPSYAPTYESSYEPTYKPTHEPTYKSTYAENTTIHEETSDKTPKNDGYDNDEFIISDKNSSAVSVINSVEQIDGEEISEKSLEQTSIEEKSEKTPKNDDKDEFIISDKNSSAVSVINSVEQIDGEKNPEKSLEQPTTEDNEIDFEQAADSAFPDINEAPESYSVESEEGFSPEEEKGNNGFYPDDNDLEELIQEDGDDDGPNDSHVNDNSVGDHADVQDDSHGGDSDVEFYV